MDASERVTLSAEKAESRSIHTPVGKRIWVGCTHGYRNIVSFRRLREGDASCDA
jgi:hypothetical protein